MEKKIVGLNTYFKSLEYENFDEYEFSARISLLDYDAVVINAEYLITCYSTSYDSSYQNKPCLSDYNSAQILEDFKKIEGQIKELLKQGRNVFVLMGNNDNCYIYTGEKQYSGTGRNARQTNIVREFNAYSFLPIKLNVTEVVGERIDICCSSPYRDFFTNTRTCYYYASYFSVAENSTILGKIKGTDKVVAAVIPYGSGKIVLLPQIYEEEEYKTEDVWKENGKKYLDSLFELNRRLKITDEEMDLPGWAQNIYILDEKVKLKKQNTIENKIAKLEKELDKERIAVQEVQKYKLLLTSSGTTLEEIVKQVLDELGFTILEAEKGRSDIIAKYGEVAIVAEIKGVRKLKSLGIETQFLTANMTSMGNSEFVLTIFGALAQEESANTSKRIKFGKKMNAEKGRVPNIVFGYDKTIGDYFNLSINENEAKAICQIFQWYTEVGYGGSKIANMLNERGIKTKRGNNWSQNAVC